MENSDTQPIATVIHVREQDGDKDNIPGKTIGDELESHDNFKADRQTEVPPVSTRSTSQVDLIQGEESARTDSTQEDVKRKAVAFQTDGSQVDVQGGKEQTNDSKEDFSDDKDQSETNSTHGLSGVRGHSGGSTSSNVADKSNEVQNIADSAVMSSVDTRSDNTGEQLNSTESTIGNNDATDNKTELSTKDIDTKVNSEKSDTENEDKSTNQGSIRGGVVPKGRSALSDDKTHKDEDSDSNVRDTDPLLSKTDSQKTLQSDTGSSVTSDSSSDTKKTSTQNKKKYSYIPIVATGKEKNSSDPKRKKSDNTPPGKFDPKRDKDKPSVRTSRISLSGNSQNIAMKDKTEPPASVDAKGETTFSIVNEDEKNDRSNKNVKWKEGDKDKKPLPTAKKESKIPELDKKKQNLIQKTLQREKAVLTNGSVKPSDKENIEKNVNNSVDNNVVKTETIVTMDSEKKVPLDNPPVVDTKSDVFKPKSILARAIMKKVKEGSGQGQNNLNSDNKHVVLNGPPPAVKTPSKKSLTVPSPVPRDINDDKEERLSIGSRRDSTKLSLSDSMSRKSVDYRVANATTVVIPASGQEEDKPKSVVTNDSWIRSAIPYLPLSMSIFCLFLNIFVPGSGTVLSGFAILCCGKARVTTKDDHVPITLCVNVWVGVAQLFTVTFMLVGWFWSMAWGIKMVILSIEYRKELKQKREKELQALALSAFGSPAHTRSLFG